MVFAQDTKAIDVEKFARLFGFNNPVREVPDHENQVTKRGHQESGALGCSVSQLGA